MKPTWVLSDAHAGFDATKDLALLQLLQAGRRAQVDLLVLGDLFTAWLGPRRFHTAGQARLLDELRLIRHAGGRVRFVPGNRDYLSEAQVGRAFDEVLPREAIVNLGGQATLLHHGDGLDSSDWSYRAWRALSRCRPAEAVLRSMPGSWGRQLARRTEAQMASMNQNHKASGLPVLALERLAQRAAHGGAQRALVGHFHRDEVMPVPAAVPVVLAPAFFDTGRLLVGTELRSTAAFELLARWPEPR